MSGTFVAEDLQRVRREFAANRFLGIEALLEELRSALAEGETARGSALLAEVNEGDYPVWPGKAELLLDLQDIVLLRQGGIEKLSEHYERRRLAAADDAETHLRLGILYQSQGHLEAARHLYDCCLALWEGTGNPRAQRARDLLLTLDHQQRQGEMHRSFRQLWQELASGDLEIRRRVREAVDAALADGDWRQGREAVAALESLEEWQAIAGAIATAGPQVQTAALAAIRRHDPLDHGPAVLRGLEAADGVVRWQAALALGAVGRRAAELLEQRLQQDPSAAVRLAAVESLARLAGPALAAMLADRLRHDEDAGVRVAAATALEELGDRRVLLDLAQAADGLNLQGESVREAAAAAARSIEARSPSEAPPTEESSRESGTDVGSPIPDDEVRSFRRRARALAKYHVLLGTVVVGMASIWMAAGYLLYAASAKGLIEPAAAPFDFFAGKPCYTSRPSLSPRLAWLRSRLRPSLFYLPLTIVPVLCYGLLLLIRFSWWLLVLPPLVHAVLFAVRHFDRTSNVCPSCPARPMCPLWARFGNEALLSRRPG